MDLLQSQQGISLDVHNDDWADIVIAIRGGSYVRIFFASGNGSILTESIYPSAVGLTSIAVADLNNDGQMDIVVGNNVDRSISIRFGNSNRAFKYQMRVSMSNGSRPRSFITGHLNNDTNTDIAVIYFDSPNVDVFLGNENKCFSTEMTFATISSPSLIIGADLNNDTYLDVIVVSSESSLMVVYLGDGYGGFIHRTTNSVGDRAQPASLSVAHFDNDNIPDIIMANYDANNIVLFRGCGDGTFSEKIELWIGYATHPFALSVGDFNGDKKLDFAIANYGRDNLEIHLQNC